MPANYWKVWLRENLLTKDADVPLYAAGVGYVDRYVGTVRPDGAQGDAGHYASREIVVGK